MKYNYSQVENQVFIPERFYGTPLCFWYCNWHWDLGTTVNQNLYPTGSFLEHDDD